MQFVNFQIVKKGSQRDLREAVPQTDTGGLVEKTKVSEWRRFKELGKKAGRKFARCPTLVRGTKDMSKEEWVMNQIQKRLIILIF